MQIRDFVKPELDYFREMCNFTEDELQYFELRSKDISNIRIADILHISESQVSKLSKRVKTKIKKVL